MYYIHNLTVKTSDMGNSFYRIFNHLYSLHSIINGRKLAKQSTYICFVDAAKAFDNV